MAELEDELGLRPGTLQHTLAVYNEDCARGVDSLYHKAAEWLTPLEPPLVALDITPGRGAVVPYFTLGGLDTLPTGEVLDPGKWSRAFTPPAAPPVAWCAGPRATAAACPWATPPSPAAWPVGRSARRRVTEASERRGPAHLCRRAHASTIAARWFSPHAAGDRPAAITAKDRP